MEEQDEHEKYEEIDREMIDKMTDYMDHEIKSGQGKDGEFFQIMEDVVFPILRELLDQDVINDKHLKQHLEELKDKDKKLEQIEALSGGIEIDLSRIVEIARRK